MKKIALPTNDDLVDGHFGHCQFYTIYTIGDDNLVEKKEILPAMSGCGCKSDIASLLANMGVTVMLAGNMGEGAIQKLSGAGLEVYRGYSGNTLDVVNSFLKGNLGNNTVCSHTHNHGDGAHSCNH